MDWINKIINSKSKVKKTDIEPEYNYEALFGDIESDVDLENPIIELSVKDDECIVSAVVDERSNSTQHEGKIENRNSENEFGSFDDEEDLERDISETANRLTECNDENRIRIEFKRLKTSIQNLNLDLIKEAEMVYRLADALHVEFDGNDMVGLRQIEDVERDFPEYENLDDVEFEPSSGFEKEPFVSSEIDNLENEIGENPNSFDRWQKMGDALNNGMIDVDDRPFSPSEFEPEASRYGSAIRWTDGLANPIMWSLEHDWTKRELSLIRGFLSMLSATVENRGVLLDAENIKIMAETISIENVGRTMYLLSEPWMSRKKMNSNDAMVLASKIGPKINNSLKFESLVNAGLSRSFAETAVEFENKLGQASRHELRHVVEVLRSFKTPLAYTMATSLDYVCACLGDRAAMVRVSDAIKLLLDDNMVEPESLRRDMCSVAKNWQRLAHAQYLHGDNSFESFEQRLALETIDLTGRTGKIAFDDDVELPMSLSDVELHRSVGHAFADDAGLTHMDGILKGAESNESAHPHTDPIIESIATSMGLVDKSDAEEFINALSTGHSQAGDEDYDGQSISVLTTNSKDDRIRIRVLDRIAGSDGNSSAERNYGHLLHPLPILPSPDPDKLYSELMIEFPWMSEINEAVARAAAFSSRNIGECFTIPTMLLNGPSGVGKTRWVRRVGQLSSIPIHFISVAGSDSSKSIMGSERGWSNARPSLPVLALSSTQVVNPIIMVDELDKANASSNGDPFAALLPMLANETNTTYPDAYLLGSVNLSYTSFIFTSNSISKLGTALLDRLAVFNIAAPSHKDYAVILRGMITETTQNAFLDGAEAESLIDPLMGIGMDCLARGDSLRKVERAVNEAVAKHIWKPKVHLKVVK